MQIGFRHSPSFSLQKKDHAGWPATGLNFLEHQFGLEHPEESDYDTTADIFSALSNVNLEDDMPVDLTKSFLSDIIASLQVDKPARLKQQIIRFIRQFSRRILDAGGEAMSEEEKRILLSAIVCEVDAERGKDCMHIWKDMITSRVWRPYLRLEHLKILESLASSSGFRIGDIGNTKLFSALADENLLNGAILKTWFQVFWLPLHIPFPFSERTRQAKSAIKKLFIPRPELMDDFRAAINLQMQNEIYKAYPDNIQVARDSLEEVCKDVTSTLHPELHAPSTSLV
jgi:hypothetical protein